MTHWIGDPVLRPRMVLPPRPARPGPAQYHDWLAAELFDRRTVQVRGHLDADQATRVTAELLTLDAVGDEPIALHVNSGSGTMEGALAVVDTLDVVGVRVHAHVLGAAEGPAMWIVALCDRRTAGPNSRLALTAPPVERQGHLTDLQRHVEQVRAELTSVADRLAERCRLTPAEVASALEERRPWRPAEAVEASLLDEVTAPRAEVLQFPRRIGYRLR